MKLAAKLSALLAGATVVPLVLTTAITQPGNRAALRAQLDTLYQQGAQSLAAEVTLHVTSKTRVLQSMVQALPLGQLEQDELVKALQLLYQSTENASVIGLYDAGGRRVVDPLWLDANTKDRPEFSEPTTVGGVAFFEKNLPLEKTLKTGGPVVGPPYVVADPSGQPMPRVALALVVKGSGDVPWVLAVETSLRPLVRRFSGFKVGDTGRAVLLEEHATTVIHPDPVVMGDRKSYRAHPLLTGAGDRDAWVGAVTPVESLGWMVMVEQDSSEALATIDEQFRESLLLAALALGGAVALALFAVRSVTGPVNAIKAAAEAVASGFYDARLTVPGKDELAQLAESFNSMGQRLQEHERLRKTFSRYVSDAVANRILREASDLDLKGEQVEVTVLFLDVRHFSTLADVYPPAAVVALLNAYFERIVKVITDHEGVINKFIGDAIMAVFGVPKEIPDPEGRAVAAALQIQALVRELNQERRQEGKEVLELGIGVNTGPAIAGNVGSKERLEYTVIGDAVNVAQRLQAMSGSGEVHISTATYARLRGRFEVEHRGEVKVKGKERPVEIYKVLSQRGTGAGLLRRTTSS